MPKEKKRKYDGYAKSTEIPGHTSGIETSKPTAIFKPTGGRKHTLSIALPGSIIANATSHDQRTYLAGTIARALAVFCVDEVVVFDDNASSTPRVDDEFSKTTTPDTEKYTGILDPCHFLAHLLSYLETPPHLRKTLFPMHQNLRTAGTLPSLDLPHHLRAHEWCDYREGVATSTNNRGTFVDVGLGDPYLLVDLQIPSKTRVTIQLDPDSNVANAVSAAEPRETAGYYWGYSVRRCTTLSSVFTESPFDGGYDLSFGTSERGKALSSVLEANRSSQMPFNHMLIVFGGVAGLEFAAKNDPDLQKTGITSSNVGELFDHYVNVMPGQGSRTIRTEEAVWLGLLGLRELVDQRK